MHLRRCAVVGLQVLVILIRAGSVLRICLVARGHWDLRGLKDRLDLLLRLRALVLQLRCAWLIMSRAFRERRNGLLPHLMLVSRGHLPLML